MSEHLDIKLLGKDYRVACAPAERDALKAAVALLDAKFKEAGDKTHGSGERLAVMVALNLAHELLALKASSNDAKAPAQIVLETDSVQRMINSIESKIDESLAEYEQIS